jgi:hypothetical protein
LEEIASFISTRGSCLEDNNHINEAFLCFHWAYQLTEDRRYYSEAAKLQRRIEEAGRLRTESLRELEAMQRERRTVKTDREPRLFRPVHSASCQCAKCIQQKEGLSHPPSCGCSVCLHQRRQSGMDFGHGPSCQCLHCRQERSKSKLSGRPFLGSQFP